MKLYTRSGDDGSTGLFGGGRVSKDAPRVEAYGAVDELNACMGIVVATCDPQREWEMRLPGMLTPIQARLFDLGADLATTIGSPHEDKVTRIADEHIETLERNIDDVDGGNEPLTQFVLPGGTSLAAHLHLARCVCRRAERRVITLATEDPGGTNVKTVIFLNRLSDLLFAMARRSNREAGVPDVPWTPG